MDEIEARVIAALDATGVAYELVPCDPAFADTAEFCERYDQNCFDPDYESLPLEFFEPMVRRVFAEPRYLERY